jgi:hypothetical protein
MLLAPTIVVVIDMGGVSPVFRLFPANVTATPGYFGVLPDNDIGHELLFRVIPTALLGLFMDLDPGHRDAYPDQGPDQGLRISDGRLELGYMTHS